MGGSQEIETEELETTIENNGPQLAICLVSGGMDSCVTAAIANEENDELAFLHVSYGQRTEKREHEAFEALADHYNVKSRLVISLEHLAKIGDRTKRYRAGRAAAPDLVVLQGVEIGMWKLRFLRAATAGISRGRRHRS